MSEYWKLSLSEGLRRMEEGTLGAAEWTRSLLSRIDACEDRVKAWAQVDREGALDAAERVDDARSGGAGLGPLAGAPYAAKDIIDVRGLRREAGTEILKGEAAAEDAVCVARLRDAGAIALGKAVTTPFAQGDPSITRNPWNLERSPGGSSSGSAAAVGAGMVPAAFGSQTTGSTLRPAAYCGVPALKPTYGRIPRTGLIKVSWNFDHVGVIARGVEDIARILAAAAGPDGADHRAVEAPPPPAEIAPRKPEKIAWLKHVLDQASAEVAEWTERAVSRIESAGVAVEEVELPLSLEEINAAHFIARCVDAAAHHQDLYEAHGERLPPYVRRSLTIGYMTPAVHYVRAMRIRANFTRKMDDLMSRRDLLALPSFDAGAPPWEESTGAPAFLQPLTFSGQPAVTLPLGRGDMNLPLGIQFGAMRLGEEKLLAMARWFEDEMGWLAEFPDL